MPSLTSFYIDETDGDISNVCSQIPAIEYWHDGTDSLPSNNNKIYTDSIGSTVYQGNASLHLISTTPLMSPPVSGGIYISVDSNGDVIQNSGCDCTEYAVPFIYILLRVRKYLLIY
jgi:hypothetical protein